MVYPSRANAEKGKGEKRTIDRLRDKPVQRQNSILHILIHKRPLDPLDVGLRLAERFENDDAVAQERSEVAEFVQRNGHGAEEACLDENYGCLGLASSFLD